MEKAAENKVITIYHGSNKILKVPEFGKGEINNDYGQGFYCTKNKGLAGEWAVLWTGQDGYINEYSLDYTNLKVLYLNQMPVENWIAVLVANRRGDYEEEYQGRINLFIDKFGIDISVYDIIEGWRADDAFFTYVEDFFAMALSVEKLQEALKFGDLGNQVCLKSKDAFDAIKFTASYPAAASRFYKSAQDRDTSAKRQYYRMKNKDAGTLLINLTGGWN
jgi:hypothetical protein